MGHLRLSAAKETFASPATARVAHSQTPRRAFYPTLKRAADAAFALFLLILTSPVLLATAAALRLAKGKVLDRSRRSGLAGRPFDLYTFAMSRGFMRHWPILFNIVRGDLSFIGPRAAAPGEFRETGLRRNTVRPGLICDCWVRRRANLAFDDEILIDAEYVDRMSLGHDLGLLLRASPALLWCAIAGAGRQPAYAERVRIGYIGIDNLTMRDAIDRILRFTREDRPRQVCFVNPQCANAAYNNAAYTAVLAKADLVLGDGIGIKFAGKILGREIRENVNGTDMFPRLCETMNAGRYGIYLLGAQPGTADRVADWIETRYPNVEIKGRHHGYFADDEDDIIAAIAASGADILLVAMGAPRQDMWIAQNLERLGVKVAIGVGGLFDFYSGRIPRAPQWMREIGLEWFYRMCQEPGRMWRRYIIGNNVFLFHVIKERLLKNRA